MTLWWMAELVGLTWLMAGSIVCLAFTGGKTAAFLRAPMRPFRDELSAVLNRLSRRRLRMRPGHGPR